MHPAEKDYPYQTTGISGQQRRLKYALLYLKYGKKIQALLATGKFGVQAYRRSGWPASRIFEWGYFTEQTKHSADEQNTDQQNSRTAPRLLYVGRLDNNKRILHLIHALKSFRWQMKMSCASCSPMTSLFFPACMTDGAPSSMKRSSKACAFYVPIVAARHACWTAYIGEEHFHGMKKAAWNGSCAIG